MHRRAVLEESEGADASVYYAGTRLTFRNSAVILAES